MIDVVKETINLLLADTDLMSLLKNNKSAICRVRAPDDSKPRVEVSIMDDADEDTYDNRSLTYSADIRISIYKGDSMTFDIGNRVNTVLKEYGFERMRHAEDYNYNLSLYVREMAYRCKILIEGDEYSWLK